VLPNHKFLTIDFETRSPVDLRSASTVRYASHPETDILCLGMKWNDRPASALSPLKGRYVLDGSLRPIEIQHAIENRLNICVHNWSFERRIYRHICVARWGWPDIPDELVVDTAAVCRYYAIPAKLEAAAKALGLESQKDMEGNRVMLQLSKPRKPRKKEVADWLKTHDTLDGFPTLWWEDETKLNRVIEYCMKDLVTQEQLFLKIGKLPPARDVEWRFDEMVNERGVPVDWGGLLAASQVIEQSMAGYCEKLKVITATPSCPEGMVTSPTQRKKILDFCDLMGWSMVSTNKESVEDALSSSALPDKVREVLTIVQDAGKSSLGKVETMLDLTDDDWRIRDSLAWHGAATGRKAGRGMQPQNFPRDAMGDEEATKFHELLAGPDALENLEFCYQSSLMVNEPQSIPDVVSSALRSFIRAEDGKSLFISDFSNIETRNLAWVADCRLLNEAFSTGKCPYRQFASRVYNITPDSIAKGSQERQLGKVAVLGLGYGMGHAKFQATAAAPPYNIELSEDRAKEIVKLYRETYPEVPKFWQACEAGFLKAINENSQVQVGKVSFGSNGEWGWIILPSGRPIWMREPRVNRVPDRWREGKTRLEITYMGVDSKTKQWVRRGTYGGSLCESICQGIAACLLQESLHRLEANGYPVILSVHDECVVEAPEHMPLDRFDVLMKARPNWAIDLPVECESHKSKRYGK
jgi:DNA polymerase